MTKSGPAGASNRVVIADATAFEGTWHDAERFVPAGVPAAAAFLSDDLARPVGAAWAASVDPARETLIAAAGRVDDTRRNELRADGLAVVTAEGIEAPLKARPADSGRVWLLTSGTTGRPKQVAHTLASLTTVTGEHPARTWLCPYTPGTYAWWQVVTLSLTIPGQDIVFVDGTKPADWPRHAADAGVTAASGTPTFWRQAIFRAGDTLAGLPLEQITLGGESVDQAILDQLADIFPTARISWIYASSEAGAALSVHDGRAGFPVRWLDRSTPGRPTLSVEDDELIIASAHSAEGMDAVIRTGDGVEVVDDRVLITGRIASDEINVGGAKASASQVRHVLLDHPDVAWASVRGRKAPLVGHVVQAEVVAEPGVESTDLANRLTAWCADRLPDYAVPRRVRVLPEIPIKESLKSDV